MRNIVTSLVAIFLLSSCANYNDDTPTSDARKATPSPKKSGVYAENFDLSIKPGDDFMSYVNGTWIKNTEIPSDKASYGIGFMLHERSQEDVKAIIEETSGGNFGKGSDEQKVGDLYRSYMDTEKREALSLTPLTSELKKIVAIRSYDDVARYFARANKLGLDMPFGLSLFPDLKAPERYAMYTWQGGLGLPDRDYYFNDDEKSQTLRDQYRQHIANMMRITNLGGDNEANTIYQLEEKLAASHMKKEDTRNIVGLYNPYTRDELKMLAGNFNWEAYLESADLEDLPRLIIAMKDYTSDFNQIFANTSLDTWKTFFNWKLVSAAAELLTQELDEERFSFQSALTGAETQPPLWRRGVNIVNATLGEVVGKVYVKKHFPPEAKARMQELVGNLIKAYEISIKNLDWMGEETRAQALDKLSKFTPKVGYPDIWKDYSQLEIKSDDLVGNIVRSNMVEYARDVEKLKGPVQKHEWQMTPQTVNAYYNPTQNEIVFPAAILQPPFFDMSVEDATNYGGIGAIIGHEIGHGFDDAGSTFDGDGVLRNWWTDQDREEFKKRTAQLVDQYDEFKVFDDLNVNGEFTLGENIGDLGGLSIALKAYDLSLGGKTAPVIGGYTGHQRVFIGWGQSWLKKSREEALRTQVGTDPHSPAKFRVNGVVRNIPEFYDAFNVGKDDALYLPPEQRVRIW